MTRLGIREATKLAMDHAIGILEATDDGAFWGEDFFDAHENDWNTLIKARKIVLKRIQRCNPHSERER